MTSVVKGICPVRTRGSSLDADVQTPKLGICAFIYLFILSSQPIDENIWAQRQKTPQNRNC